MPDKNKLLGSLPEIDGAQSTAPAEPVSQATGGSSLLASLPEIDGSVGVVGGFDADVLAQKIADVESNGGNYAALPWRTDETGKRYLASTAVGKYQFLWGKSPDKGFGEDIKRVTGVKSKREYLDSPKAQEQYFKYHLENNLKPSVEELRSLNKAGYDDSQLAMLVHFKGPGGAKQWLTSHSDDTQTNNTSIDTYLGKPAGVSRGTIDMPTSSPVQSLVNDTDPQQDKDNLTHANDYLSNMLGADFAKPVDATADTHKNVIANEVNSAKKFVANDARQYLSSLPPQAVDQLQRSGIDPNNFIEKLTAPAGGENELNQYYKARIAAGDEQYQQKRSALMDEIKQLASPVSLSIENKDIPFNRFSAIKAKNEELDHLKELHDQQSDAIHNTVFNLAATKVVNSELQSYDAADASEKSGAISFIKPEELGAKVLSVMGDNVATKIANNGEEDPIQKAERQRVGYQAMQYAMADAYANGDMDLAKSLQGKTKNYNEKILADNPAFKKIVFANAISKEIDKRGNTFTNFFLGTGGDKTYIDKVGRELGIRPEDLSGIEPADMYHDPGVVMKLAGGILRPVVETGQTLMNVSGGDKKGQFSEFWNNNDVGRSLGWNKTEENGDGLRTGMSSVDTNPESPTYGQQIKNEDGGKYKLGWNTIGSEVANGISMMAPMIAGQTALSATLQGANLIRNEKLAEKVGLGIYTYITGYDGNYQKARQVVGDDPEKEVERVMLGNLYNSIETMALQVLPAKDVADKWIGTAAGNEFIDLVAKKGIKKVTADMAKPYIVNGLKEGLKDLGKGVSMGVINQLGDNIADMAFAPKKFEQTNVLDDLQQNVITGAIQMMLPTVGGGILHARSAGPMYKNAMFEIGTNPQPFVDHIASEVAAGKMDKGVGDERIRSINSIASIYRNSVPPVSVLNGENLTPDQQKDYGVNIIAEKQLEAQKESVNDPVQEKALGSQINELQAERERILNEAGDQPTIDDNKIKVSEMVGRKVMYNGEPARVSVDPETNRVIITNEKTGTEYDNVGNILNVGDESAKSLGLEEINTATGGKSVVSIADNGNVDVRGKEYSIPVEHAENPLAVINYDNRPGKKGVPVSVTLDQPTANGGTKKVTFRGNVAEDIRYQLHLQKLDKENAYDKLEEFINTDEEARTQMENGRSAEASPERAAADNGEVSEAEGINKDLVSPNKTKNDASKRKSEEVENDVETRDGQDSEINGENKSRRNVGDELQEVSGNDGRKVRNEQQRGVTPASEISGPAPVDATNPFGFESESTGPHDLFHQPAAPEPAKGKVSFKTSKGSEYDVNDDGTTTRNKAARIDVGHEGDSGLKEPSSKTFYVTKEDLSKLDLVQADGFADGVRPVIADIGDGKIAVGIRGGKDEGKYVGRTVVQYKTDPAVGLFPLEIWNNGGRHHFGNEITEVKNEGVAKPVEEKAKPVVADLTNTDSKESVAEQNRKEGVYEKDGQVYVRNEELKSPTGKDGVVQFADGVDQSYTYQLVDAKDLQPAHSGGNRNPNFFIPEAQPKERSDAGSIAASDKIGNSPDLNKVGDSPNAYSGAPVVNARGEVIQGNNRSEGLKKHYGQKGTLYKSQLTANAEKYGFTKQQVRDMKEPVLVRRVNVTDEQAIKLGNHDAKDIETGGKTRIDPVATSRRIPMDEKNKIVDALVSENDDKTLNSSIRENFKKVFEVLKKHLSASQVNALVDKSGELTQKGVEDVEGLVTHFLFDQGDVNLPDLFGGMSHTAKKGVLKSFPKLFSVAEENSLVPDVQNAIIAHADFDNSGADFNSWKIQPDMFRGNRSPMDTYTPLELNIAEKLSSAKSQKEIQESFAKYAELVNGKPGDMFGAAVEPISREAAINEVFNKPKDENKSGRKDAAGSEEVGGKPIQEAIAKPAEAVAKEDVPADNGGQNKPAPVAGPGPVKGRQGIDELTTERNKISELHTAKQREIELLEERKGKMLADKETLRTEKGKRDLSEIDAQLDRAEATLKSRKNLLTKAERELKAAQSKGLAAEIRSGKKAYVEEKKGDKPVKNSLFDDEVVQKIGVKLYNASLEVAARAVEAGQSVKSAVQSAVDYIHDRHFTSWSEAKFRENLGDNLDIYTPETLRNKKISENPLSEKNKAAADMLVESVRDNKNSLQSAYAHLDALNIDDATREKLRSYIRQRVIDEVHKATGEQMAKKHLKAAGGDFEEALKNMGDEFDTHTLNAKTQQERENLRSKYAAAKANLESQHTTEKVKNGDIDPVYKVTEPVTGPQFKMPAYDRDAKGNLTRKGKVQEVKDKTATNMQDRYSRLETAQNNSIVPITPENDAVTAMRLKKSKAWEKIAQVRDYMGNIEHKAGSLFDRMKKDAINIDKFGLYLYAKHAEERNEYNARLRQKLFDGKVFDLNQKIAEAEDHPVQQKKYKDQLRDILDQKDPRYALMPDGGSGMTNEQAQEILSEVETDPQKDKYEAYAKEFRENVVNRILDEKHESGVISDEDHNHLKNFYQNYVPLKVKDEVIRAENDGEEDNKFISNSAISGKELYRSKGANHREILDRNNPMLQAALDLEHSMVKGEDNKANVALSNFVKMNPNENVWEIKPAQYETIKDVNGNIVRAYENPDTRPNNAIPYYENGKKSYIILRDKGMVQMNKQLGSNMFLKVMGPVSHFVAAVNTLSNPEFFLKNVFYDQQDAYMSLLGSDNPELVKKFRKYNPLKLAKEIVAGNTSSEWGKWVQEWKDKGGEISYLKALDSEKHAEQSSKIYEQYDSKNPLSKSQRNRLYSKVKDFASTLEQTTRVMAYRAAVEGEAARIEKTEGISHDEAMDKVNRDKAAVISRNATVDFEKKGVYGAYIGAFKAFANAGIQGTANLVYLAAKSKRVKQFLGAMVMAGMAESEIARLLGDCKDPSSEDCYLGQPEYRKERSFMIPLKPFGGHGYASIPVGRNFGWFNYAGKKIDEFLHGEVDPAEFMGTTMGSLLDYYDPSGGNAPVEQKLTGNLAPIVQYSTNKNNFGTPIEPEQKAGKFASENFFPKTNEEFISAAHMIHEVTGGNADKPGKVEISPDRLQFIAQTVFGGLGKFAGSTYEAIGNAANREGVKANDIPVARTFYRTGNMARVKQEYYDIADKSKTVALSAEEQRKVVANLQMLVKGNEISEEQAANRMNFIKRNQSSVHKGIQGRVDKGEHSDMEDTFDGGGSTGDY